MISRISQGHKIIDSVKLARFLKRLLPKKFNETERTLLAYKIAEYEDQITYKKGDN